MQPSFGKQYVAGRNKRKLLGAPYRTHNLGHYVLKAIHGAHLNLISEFLKVAAVTNGTINKTVVPNKSLPGTRKTPA